MIHNPLSALSRAESFQNCQSFSLRAENPGHSEPGFNFSSKRGIWVSASPAWGKEGINTARLIFHIQTHSHLPGFFFSQAIALVLLWKSLVRMVGKRKGAFQPLKPGDAKLQPSLPRLKRLGFPKQLKTLPN